MWTHVRQESDEYEERELAEFAAENQVHQEQRWAPHNALSDVHYDVYQHNSFPRPSAFKSQSPVYEPASYGNDVDVSAFHPSASFGLYTSTSPRSITSRNCNDSNVRQSFQLSDRSSAAQLVKSPASFFDVQAAHHLFSTFIQSADRNSVQHSSTQLGDPLPDFPQWSRTWYNGHLSADGHACTTVAPGSGQSGWESESYGCYGPHTMHDPRDRINDHVKKERIYMLKKGFGPQSSHGDDNDEDKEALPKELPVGCINADGHLVWPARKLCISARCFQCLLSLTAAGCGIGGFALIHPTTKAAPSGTLPAFTIYAVSAISTLACLWLFALKPCCAGGRQRDALASVESGIGGMVLPVTAGGLQERLGKKKKGKQQQGTVVNVILDPAIFLQNTGESDSDMNDVAEGTHRNKKRKSKRRSQVNRLAEMRVQAQWRLARQALRWECACDVTLCLLWSAAAVFALGFGQSCPAGTAEGWCNLYNGAIACTVLATVACMVAIYCDILRLKASRRAP